MVVCDRLPGQDASIASYSGFDAAAHECSIGCVVCLKERDIDKGRLGSLSEPIDKLPLDCSRHSIFCDGLIGLVSIHD